MLKRCILVSEKETKGALLVQCGKHLWQNYICSLTPLECERLQGFPDNYTQIEWHGKPAEQCPDSLRYKAIGNSMAVPVMRWIGERIKRMAGENTMKQNLNEKMQKRRIYKNAIK